jgi:hypothetical protein
MSLRCFFFGHRCCPVVCSYGVFAQNPNFIHHRTIQSDDEIRIPLIPHRDSHTEVDAGLTGDGSAAVPATQKRRAVHFGDDTEVETQPRKVRRITVKFADDKQRDTALLEIER